MLYFLASIPRSGSTLLASLLGQREDTYVSPTSNLGDILGSVVKEFESSAATKAGGHNKEQLYRSLKAISESQYSERTEEIIFDKGRAWSASTIIETMEKSIGDIKIVATVRPIAECIASFYEIENKDIPVKRWIKKSSLMEHLMFSYDALKNGYEKYPDKFCIIEYDDLCNHTQRELDRISDFIGVDHVAYNAHIDQVKENDNAWGIKDLHKLAPTIEKNKNNAKEILGEEYWELYQGGEFWNTKCEPIPVKKPLDLALEAALRGETSKSYNILKTWEKDKPHCDRTKFNLGWHEMERGNLLKGHKLMTHGRNEEVFGSPNPGLSTPIWNGERDCTVMMKMEGGIGDQLHGIRYSENISRDFNCDVIVSGDEKLVDLCKDVVGVTAYCQHEVAGGVYHDYWIPNMSVTIPLELEWSDVSGKVYIARDGKSEGKVGIKWSGNPKFEHEQHRLFPADLMFDTVKDLDCISLQKDDGKTAGLTPAPDWMDTPSLETSVHTRKQISRCDLVITSCTTIAHLAGAMGIETWVIVPVMSYYLWSYPGDKSPFYDSIKLFRQEKYGEWEAPFKQIKQELIKRKISLWNKFPMGETTKSFIEA